MDVVSSVSAMVGLVFNFATAIKTINDIRGRYKDAGRTIESISHELETLQGALQELVNLMMHDASALSSRWDTNKTLPTTFARAMKGFERTIKGLQDDIEPLRGESSRPTRMNKAKVVWNEDRMNQHVGRLHGQSNALQLLLLVLQTSSVSDVKSNLSKVEEALIQLFNSTNANDMEGNENLPTYAIPLNGQPSHILDFEEDLLDLNWPDVTTTMAQMAELQVGARTMEKVSPQADFAAHESSSTDPEFVGIPTPQSPGRSSEAQLRSTSNSEQVPGSVLRPASTDNHHSPSITDAVERAENSENIQSSIGSLTEAPDVVVSIAPEVSIRTADTSNVSTIMPQLPQLIHAVMRNDIEEAKMLLDYGSDINAVHPSTGRTGAILATIYGHYDILKLFLDHGASIDDMDKEHRTALHYAASEGDTLYVNLLLSYGAKVDRKDFSLEVPLHRAVRYGRTDVVKTLLPKYPNPLKPRARFRRSALHIAVSYRRDEIVRVICDHIRTKNHQPTCSLKEGNTVSLSTCDCPVIYPLMDEYDLAGSTALQLAICSGEPSVVSTLLGYSSDAIDAPYRVYVLPIDDLILRDPIIWERPLHTAIRNCQTRILPILLAVGSDVELLNSRNQTVLEYAIHRKNLEGTRALLAHGANYSHQSVKHDATSLLHEAVTTFGSIILDDLVSQKPDLDLSSVAGRTLLREIQDSDEWDMLRMLVENHSQSHEIVKILDEERTLRLAIYRSTPEMVEFLLGRGVNANAKFQVRNGSDWKRPFHFAAQAGSLPVAESLLRHGARLSDKASNNWLPMHDAIRFRHFSVARWYLSSSLRRRTNIQPSSEDYGYAIELGLQLACRSGDLEKLKLVHKYVGPLKVSEKPWEALHAAVAYGRPAMVEYLLGQGHDPRDLNKAGLSPAEITFESLKAKGDGQANRIEDHQTCKELVQDAIDQRVHRVIKVVPSDRIDFRSKPDLARKKSKLNDIETSKNKTTRASRLSKLLRSSQ